MRLFAAVLVLVFTVGLPAWGQTRNENLRRCDEGDADASIGGCTALIQSGQESNQNLSIQHYNRGWAYSKKGNYDRAIQDYDEAIRLNPSYAVAFSNRGMEYFAKGNYDRAIQDFDETIRLDPSKADKFLNRGMIRFFLGQFATAQPDLARALELDSHSNALLWLYLARSRAGQDARSELERNVAHIELSPRGGKTVNLFLGKAIPETLLIAATDPDAEADRRQHCEAYFYLGEYALIGGNSVEAKRLFQQAIDTGQTTLAEYTGAQAELKRLSASPVKTGGTAVKRPVAAAPAAKRTTLADEVLEHLTASADYRDLQALYDLNATQPGWTASDEGTAISQQLAMYRSDALAITIVGGLLQYSIGGHKVTDQGISAYDLKQSKSYRSTIAEAIASNIASYHPNAEGQAALDRFRASQK